MKKLGFKIEIYTYFTLHQVISIKKEERKSLKLNVDSLKSIKWKRIQ